MLPSTCDWVPHGTCLLGITQRPTVKALTHSGCRHLWYYRHTWWHPEHKRGWGPQGVESQCWRWQKDRRERERTQYPPQAPQVLSRLKEGAEQDSFSPCLPSAQSLFSTQRAGAPTALLWPEERRALSNSPHHCRSLVSVTTAGNTAHTQVSNRYNI